MIRDILVHMDRGPGCTARLMAAIALAQQHAACLKGLYVIAHPHYASSSDYLNDFSQVRELFINATSKAGILSEWVLVDWTVVGTPLQNIVCQHAYFNDLILVGQPAYLKNRKASLEYHEHLFLAAGRPVVVFPAAGEVFKTGNRIAIAWKGGRESVRAVHDALPLLKKAQHVDLVSVVKNKHEQQLEEASMAEMQKHLACHGVLSSISTLALQVSITATLQQHTITTDSDLMVLGAFAYTSNKVPQLNPVARELLIHCHIPLLMAH